MSTASKTNSALGRALPFDQGMQIAAPLGVQCVALLLAQVTTIKPARNGLLVLFQAAAFIVVQGPGRPQ
eukprot:12821990-Prorocentrum_lima.AAC.1